jgi:hypothetical protein
MVDRDDVDGFSIEIYIPRPEILPHRGVIHIAEAYKRKGFLHRPCIAKAYAAVSSKPKKDAKTGPGFTIDFFTGSCHRIRPHPGGWLLA